MFKRECLMLAAMLAGLWLCGCAGSVKEKYLDGAKRGIPEFQAGAGAMYINGGPTEINYEEALAWLKAAAAENNAVATAYLAEYYDRGYGTANPDRQRAARLYEKAFETLQRQAGENQVGACYSLGKMYRNGNLVPVNYQLALQLFRPGVTAGYAPAINQTGEMLAAGQGCAANNEKAREMFFSAAEKNLPAAQLNLAEYYFAAGNPNAGIKWLSRAAENKYPPAQFALAEQLSTGKNTTKDSERAAALLQDSAASGWAPAQMRLAEQTTSPELKLSLLRKSAERDYGPALLALGDLLLSTTPYGQTKAMALYELARKSGHAPAAAKIAELDATTGIYLAVKFSWFEYQGGECFALSDSPIERIIAGYRAGITSGTRTIFEQELQKSPVPFYLNNDWFQIYRCGLPFAWAGDIFRLVPEKEKERPGYWFCYGMCISLAGHGEGLMFAGHRLNELLEKMPDSEDKALLRELNLLFKAQALMLMGREAEAYSFLFSSGKLKNGRNPALINYVNYFGAVLLKDKNKFAVATGINESALKEYQRSEKQLFYDAQLERDTDGETPISEPVVKIQGNAEPGR